MKLGHEELSRRLAGLKSDLKRSGVKTTHQRLEIFREVARSAEHPAVETVFRGVRRRIPSISLDTVYRTLWLLLERNVIATLGPSRDRLRFDGNMLPHHHFTCRECGHVYDFQNEAFDELAVPGEVMAMGSVERTHVEFRGLCGSCRKKQGPSANIRSFNRKRRQKNG